MASNVAGRTDHAENVMPSKASSTERIDGIVALIIGLGLAIQGEGTAGSVYSDRGLLEVEM